MNNKMLFIAILLLTLLPVQAQAAKDKDLVPVADSLNSYLKERTSVYSPVSVERAAIMKDGTLRITLGRSIIDFPLRDKEIEDIYSIVRKNLPKKYSKYRDKVTIYAEKKALEFYKSNYFRSKPSDKPVKEHRKFAGQYHDNLAAPLVTRLSTPNKPTRGLQKRHIALWQSHGWYYEQSLKRWEWQRARVLETVEDLYTQSYVLPFLVPMLENAGAVVMLPRERDWNTNEVIVDNDGYDNGSYRETGYWETAPDSGFANPKEYYLYKENPFRMGSARMAYADPEGSCRACWLPDIPEDGEYAVYVSYQTLPISTMAAQYEVRHNGGRTKFSVNQQMGGRTWIYLGSFSFKKGQHEGQGVFLSNKGNEGIVSADAVKFGGGMGNMARKPLELKGEDDFEIEAEVSGYPRFTEGSRYWLQWAGFVDTIYSRNLGATDYNDDYMSRGLWVNTLSDGSYLKPKKKGYKVPLDLSFAFHTDAGTTMNDSIVGTLAIYTRLSNDEEKYPNGEDRAMGRDYTDIVQTQIVNDIRALYEPQWSRRQLWDRSYAESRMPEVPAMLLELLSHQNLADMRYGLDPSFRFTVSRAIYKGMLKFLAWINGFDYTVQPLPVKDFEVHLDSDFHACLSWTPVEDPLEETAGATGYILYTRIDDGAFDNGTEVNEASARIQIRPGHIYSFRVSATNAGGESFPSETLSLGIVSENAPTVMIVNNFDRVSAAVSFASRDSSYAGFDRGMDSGVPYLLDISFIGKQYEFRRHIPWMDDDSAGFGASESDYETKVLAGNSFDYPSVHGAAWMNSGFNFVSASRSAVIDGRVKLTDYKTLDLICGKQLTTQVGRKGSSPPRHEIFTPEIRRQIEDFTAEGGNILVSGAYVGTDIWEPVFDFEITPEYLQQTEDSKVFAREVLHFKWMTNNAAVRGEVKGIQNPLGISSRSRYIFNTELNDRIYAVESPDGLVPSGSGAYSIMRYSENNISAGIAYKGEYRTVVLGFPVETLDSRDQIDSIISEVAAFFSRQ